MYLTAGLIEGETISQHTHTHTHAGLTPFTQYEVEVAASNSDAEDGPFSNRLSNTTFEGGKRLTVPML